MFTKIEKIAAKAPFTRLTLPLQCYVRLPAAKHNIITHAAAATGNLDAAISLRSANTELQNTMQWQHATVEHILRTQQFQCTKCLDRC